MLMRSLGQTGEMLSAIGLGAMPLSMAGCPEPGAARQVVHCYVQGGGNFIDTANVYTERPEGVGENERLIVAALAEISTAMTSVHIATKGGLRRTADGWEVDASPAWLQQSCEASLQALDMDCIFLYQLHVPDPETDICESVAALESLRQAGKIRYIGLCNVKTEQIQQAQSVATISSVQNALHPRKKKSLRFGVLEYCRNAGISFIAHSPVGGYHNHRRLADDPELKKLARQHATTPENLSLAWLLHLGSHVMAIPGARRCASVQASLDSTTLELSASDIAAISALEDW